MRLLQLNVWTGRLLPQILELIDDTNPDFVCMQEVTSSPDGMIMPQARMFSTLNVILDTKRFNHHYFSPTFNFTYQGKMVNHGNAIVSRHALEDCVTHFINGSGPETLKSNEREPNIRNLQIVKVKFEGKELVLANHHGYWDESPLGNEISVERMQDVANYLKAYPAPIIMTGDLNLRSGSPPMQAFDNFLEDLNLSYGIKDTLSPLRKLGPINCDHVLVSRDVIVQGYKVRNDLVSDHKALVLDFDLS